MNAQDIKTLLIHTYKYARNRVIYLSGPPGSAKSAVTYQTVQELSTEYKEPFGFIDFRGSSQDPLELGRVAYVDGGALKFSSPDWVPDKGRGVIFCDEFLDCDKITQAAFGSLMNDKRIGDKRLGDGWMVIAAGNRREDKAAAGTFSSAAGNRLIHVTMDVDKDVCIQYAKENNWHPTIPAYWNMRPEHMCHLDHKAKDPQMFASLRSWEFASDVLTKMKLPEHMVHEVIVGCLGHAVGTEYYSAVQQYLEVEDPKKILTHPDSYPIPEKLSTLYAVVCAVSNMATKETFPAIVKFANRLTPEMAGMTIRDSVRQDKALLGTKAFSEWASKNSNFYL